jgi:hypothetical protein
VSAVASSCRRCGAALPPDAQFCPACGLKSGDDTEVLAVPRYETTASPVTYDAVMPRYFGVTPPMVVFALATAALAIAIAIAMAILAHWIAAIALAALSLVLLAWFVNVARRKPDTALARSSARAVDRMRERTGWFVESTRIRSATGKRLTRLRYELADADARRETLLRALGAAVYSGDAEATDSLREQLVRLDEEASEKEAEMHAIVDEAQERIAHGRRRVQPTMIEPPQPAPVPEPGPPPDEGTPPTPSPVPEPYPPPDEGTLPAPDPVPEPGPGGPAQRDI